MQPLGYIQLPTGPKAIAPMNDIFINFTFQEKQYWDILIKMTNIFYSAFIEEYPDTILSLIRGKVKEVKTQYPFYKTHKSGTPKQQDIFIRTNGEENYVEFQIEPYPKLKLEDRSMQYFGLSLSRGDAKTATTAWLIKGGVTALLENSCFAHYIITNEVTGKPHPNKSSILYVDLNRVAKKDHCLVAELAGILIGKVKKPTFAQTQEIYDMLTKSFNKFKKSQEVKHIMTARELWEARAEKRGYKRGKKQGEKRAFKIFLTIQNLVSEQHANEVIVTQLMAKFNLSEEKAKNMLDQYRFTTK